MLVSKKVIENSVINLIEHVKLCDKTVQIDFTVQDTLTSYIIDVLDEFENPSKSPYDLNEEEFVDNIELDCNKLHKNTDLSCMYQDNSPIDYIINSVYTDKIPVVTVGNYGMGKSTIGKYLFVKLIEKGVFSIFIELRDSSISSLFKKNKFTKNLVYTIFESYNIKPDKELVSSLLKLIYEKKVFIILDGVDESIIESEKILSDFTQFIISSEIPIYLSCRKEYSNFISTYNAKVASGSSDYKTHLYINLNDWDKKQWKSYENKLLNRKHFSKYKTQIKDFFTEIHANKYGDIPKRPLFLKMLTKLKIENDLLNKDERVSHYTLIETLTSNRSEIYYKYLRWQLYNDIIKHENSDKVNDDVYLINKERKVIDSWFELLSHIAVYEYKKILKGEKTTIYLGDILKLVKKVKGDTKFLTSDFIEKALDETSLFAILQRDKNGIAFAFSHKSFMEYLVAYRLADCIFDEEPNCDETWGYYQTHEVSQHFMFEVARVTITQGLENSNLNSFSQKGLISNRNKKLSKAFLDTLSYYLYENPINTKKYDKNDFDSEKFEEALFYIGRFQIKDNTQVLEIFENIFNDMKENGENYHPVYYRTVALVLSQIKDTKYCDEYVEFLLKDFTGENKRHFDTNLMIQKEYYGQNEIMLDKLSEYINEFINSSLLLESPEHLISLRANISNDILTYFISHETNENNYHGRSEYMKEILHKSRELNLSSLIEINEKIQKMFVEV